MKATVLILALTSTLSIAGGKPDSAKAIPSPPGYHLKLVARMHSMGMFTYGGFVASDYAATDINITYDRRSWGVMFFKAADIYDHQSLNNFSLVLLYHTFHLGKRLSFTPYAGFSAEQCHQIADKGSDATMVFTTSWKPTQRLTLDHSAMVSNLALERNHMDWTNRFRVVYAGRHVDAGIMLWHNNRVFDPVNYMSTGFNLGWSRIPVAPRVMLSTGITALWTVQSSDEVHIPTRHGMMFSIACTFDGSPLK
ncbi:MAG: hypothetical protein JST14_09940 [Bacteroidetes bacterium]|nr:hypothetical protein [Bacteroidota bacterium]